LKNVKTRRVTYLGLGKLFEIYSCDPVRLRKIGPRETPLQRQAALASPYKKKLCAVI